MLAFIKQCSNFNIIPNTKILSELKEWDKWGGGRRGKDIWCMVEWWGLIKTPTKTALFANYQSMPQASSTPSTSILPITA